jgi:hypothetical protein
MEQGKKTKIPSPPGPSKRKRLDRSRVHVEPSIGYLKLFFPKLFIIIFAKGQNFGDIGNIFRTLREPIGNLKGTC